MMCIKEEPQTSILIKHDKNLDISNYVDLTVMSNNDYNSLQITLFHNDSIAGLLSYTFVKLISKV